ncbi:MAG TPA: hypothetical protein VEX67_09175 [Solirubrobacteraceae bacterium]|nr:hypothetical protein [Solirubrobacteraceae bacterium]
MSEKTDDQSVLGSLPATRSTRIGGERGERPTRAKPKTANGKASAKPKKTAAKARAAAKPKTAAKPRAVAAPKAAPKAAATAKPAPSAAAKPRPVRAGAPSLAESTRRARAAEPERGSSPPSGTELVTTAIQAAGELAQIGLAVGGQVLKRTIGKIPKP